MEPIYATDPFPALISRSLCFLYAIEKHRGGRKKKNRRTSRTRREFFLISVKSFHRNRRLCGACTGFRSIAFF